MIKKKLLVNLTVNMTGTRAGTRLPGNTRALLLLLIGSMHNEGIGQHDSIMKCHVPLPLWPDVGLFFQCKCYLCDANNTHIGTIRHLATRVKKHGTI